DLDVSRQRSESLAMASQSREVHGDELAHGLATCGVDLGLKVDLEEKLDDRRTAIRLRCRGNVDERARHRADTVRLRLVDDVDLVIPLLALERAQDRGRAVRVGEVVQVAVGT